MQQELMTTSQETTTYESGKKYTKPQMKEVLREANAVNIVYLMAIYTMPLVKLDSGFLTASLLLHGSFHFNTLRSGLRNKTKANTFILKSHAIMVVEKNEGEV
eukprot:628248_1